MKKVLAFCRRQNKLWWTMTIGLWLLPGINALVLTQSPVVTMITIALTILLFTACVYIVTYEKKRTS